MTRVFPVYVPTKARADQPRTLKLLHDASIQATVVCEPQDCHAYHKVCEQLGHQLHVLDEDDRGLPFARQAVLVAAREAGCAWFWQIDDDVSNFYEVRGGKCVKTDARTALLGAQAQFATLQSVGQAALEYQQFAWSSKRGYATDGYCDVAVAIHATRTRGCNYRQTCLLKQDRDFTLQVLASGLHTYRCQRFAFSAPKNGSNAGGLQATYARGIEAGQSAAMVARWPGICTPHVKADGRPDVRINWRHFK